MRISSTLGRRLRRGVRITLQGGAQPLGVGFAEDPRVEPKRGKPLLVRREGVSCEEPRRSLNGRATCLLDVFVDATGQSCRLLAGNCLETRQGHPINELQRVKTERQRRRRYLKVHGEPAETDLVETARADRHSQGGLRHQERRRERVCPPLGTGCLAGFTEDVLVEVQLLSVTREQVTELVGQGEALPVRDGGGRGEDQLGVRGRGGSPRPGTGWCTPWLTS